jgi:hypothetical protein
MSHRLSEAQSTDPAREKFKHDIAIGELVPAEVAGKQINQARDRLFNELRRVASDIGIAEELVAANGVEQRRQIMRRAFGAVLLRESQPIPAIPVN